MTVWRFERELKRDVFGRVECLCRADGERAVRRVACGSRVPGSRLLARLLLARERRALQLLAGLPRVPRLLDDPELLGALGADGRPVAAGQQLCRSWMDGVPLWAATALPSDFFDLLAGDVAALHARGVCHRDLHKENNILVGTDGRPRLIDFQLARSFPRRGAAFRRDCREDLRHVDKHRRRYAGEGRGADAARRRNLPATLWMLLVKPLYNLCTRRLLRREPGEPRRPRGGPWPQRTPPVGRTDGFRGG